MKDWQPWMGPAVGIVLVLITNEFGWLVGGASLLAVLAWARYMDRRSPIEH